MSDQRIITPGKSCYRVAQSDQIDILVDAAPYYAALYRSIIHAHERIVFLGWQFDSRVSLLRGEAAARARYPVQFLPLLQKVAEERPNLRIYILAWDHSIVFIPEREWWQHYRFQETTTDQIRFVFDDLHPTGGSHHQKIVVVDGQVGFCGGLDICGDRWDTAQHSRQNPLRKNDDGTPYSLFHDVQIGIQGEAVSALEEIFCDRWEAATGAHLSFSPPRERRRIDLPHTLRLSPGPVSISRTVPIGACGQSVPIQEIAHFYDDAIASAEHLILIENQYFTSRRVYEALLKRISDKNRPPVELILVLPQAAQNWKEELAIGFEQRRLLQRLENAAKQADSPIAIYTPIKTGHDPLPPTPIYVHSKVLAIDDRILSIGSANTSNRSLGLDTECNINIEAEDDRRREEIRRACYTLLGEHLEQSPEAVEGLIRQRGGWVAALDSAWSEGKAGRLHKVSETLPDSWVDQVLPDGICFDPESPLIPEDLFETFFSGRKSEGEGREPAEEEKKEAYDENAQKEEKKEASESGSNRRSLLKEGLFFLLPLVGLFLYFVLHRRGFELQAGAALLDEVRASHWTIPLFVAGTIIASMISFPLSVCLILGGILFGAFWGTVLNWTSALAGATASYYLGLYLGKPLFRSLAEKKMPTLTEWIKKKGFWAILLLRVIGVFPFTWVNFVAGANRIRLSKYLLATAIGMLPGTVLISYFSNSILQVTTHLHKGANPLWLGIVVLLVWIGSAFLKTWWLRRQEKAFS